MDRQFSVETLRVCSVLSGCIAFSLLALTMRRVSLPVIVLIVLLAVQVFSAEARSTKVATQTFIKIDVRYMEGKTKIVFRFIIFSCE